MVGRSTLGASSAPPRLHAPRVPSEKPDISIPQARRIAVDTTGAQIVQEESPAVRSRSGLARMRALCSSSHGIEAGSKLVDGDANVQTRDSRGIYLPHYIEPVSHIAIDIGGSLAKVVYFTRQSHPLPRTPPDTSPSSPFLPPSQAVTGGISPSGLASSSRLPEDGPHIPSDAPEPRRPALNGTLTPQILSSESDYLSAHSSSSAHPSHAHPHARPHDHGHAHAHRLSTSLTNHPKLRRGSVPQRLPGGVLNFARFETAQIDDLIAWLVDLIATSAAANRVSVERMRSMVKVMVTGGGAYMYYDRLKDEVGVEVQREEEMECLILGLGFVARIPEEVFWFSDALVYKVSHPQEKPLELEAEAEPGAMAAPNGSSANGAPGPSSTLEPPSTQPPELERPSPTPPQYSVTFAHPEDGESEPNFPCLLVNIGSGVSIVKVDEDGKFERVSGTSLGGGTLWGLLSLLTDARSFDEMLLLSEKGDNAAVDMLVGDIYGSDYSKIGLKSSTIASTFGKVFKKGQSPEERKKGFRQEDVARSLLYAISNNIGHVAYMNAAKYGLNKVFFGGCFIRGHAATISTLSYAIRFWSKGTMRACFLRHEGFLGSIGAYIKNIESEIAGEGGASGRGEKDDDAAVDIAE